MVLTISELQLLVSAKSSSNIFSANDGRHLISPIAFINASHVNSEMLVNIASTWNSFCDCGSVINPSTTKLEHILP